MTTTNNTIATAHVIASREGEFEKRMERYVRRAEKYGMAAPEWEKVETYKKPVYAKDEYGRIQPGCVIGHEVWYKFEVKHADLRLPGGWRFLGVVEHDTGGENIIKSLCDDEESARLGLEVYRKAANICDHCNTNRRRKTTYLVQSKDGEVRQVGTRCVKDYLGHNVARGLGTFTLLSDACDLDWGPTEGYKPWWDLREVVAVAYHEIEENGWLSRSKSMTGHGTADDVATRFYDRLHHHKLIANALAKYGDKADKAIAWAKGITDNSEYLQNLKVLADVGATHPRRIGYAASIPVAYGRAERERRKRERRRDENAEAIAAGHLGEPGDRVGSTLSASDRRAGKAAWFLHKGKLVRVENTNKSALKGTGIKPDPVEAEVTFCCKKVTEGYSWHSPMRTLTILKFQTDTGHVFVWFKSGESDLKQGDRVALSGTVKKHDTYRGVPQTVLNYCTATPCS